MALKYILLTACMFSIVSAIKCAIIGTGLETITYTIMTSTLIMILVGGEFE